MSKKLVLYIGLCCLIYSILVLSFFVVPFFDKDLLLKLFDKYHIYDSLPFTIPYDEVKNFVYELMDFLIGKKAFLNTKVHLDGELVNLYSNTSKIHMGDCRNLFMAHGYLAKIMLLPAIFGIVYTIMSDKEWYNSLFKAYRNLLITFFILLSIIIAIASINFDFFFTTFHKIFFDNDLWLFDPNVDYIINYLQEIIFIDIGVRIAIFAVLFLLLLLLILYLLKKTLSTPASR